MQLSTACPTQALAVVGLMLQAWTLGRASQLSSLFRKIVLELPSVRGMGASMVGVVPGKPAVLHTSAAAVGPRLSEHSGHHSLLLLLLMRSSTPPPAPRRAVPGQKVGPATAGPGQQHESGAQQAQHAPLALQPHACLLTGGTTFARNLRSLSGQPHQAGPCQQLTRDIVGAGRGQVGVAHCPAGIYRALEQAGGAFGASQ